MQIRGVSKEYGSNRSKLSRVILLFINCYMLVTIDSKANKIGLKNPRQNLQVKGRHAQFRCREHIKTGVKTGSKTGSSEIMVIQGQKFQRVDQSQPSYYQKSNKASQIAFCSTLDVESIKRLLF